MSVRLWMVLCLIALVNRAHENIPDVSVPTGTQEERLYDYHMDGFIDNHILHLTHLNEGCALLP